MLSASLNKAFNSLLNMFSTLNSFLYPAMHQARISNVRTLGKKTSHIKLIFVKYIVKFFKSLRSLFYLNSCFSIDTISCTIIILAEVIVITNMGVTCLDRGAI